MKTRIVFGYRINSSIAVNRVKKSTVAKNLHNKRYTVISKCIVLVELTSSNTLSSFFSPLYLDIISNLAHFRVDEKLLYFFLCISWKNLYLFQIQETITIEHSNFHTYNLESYLHVAFTKYIHNNRCLFYHIHFLLSSMGLIDDSLYLSSIFNIVFSFVELL